jgi:hypothetical protein
MLSSFAFKFNLRRYSMAPNGAVYYSIYDRLKNGRLRRLNAEAGHAPCEQSGLGPGAGARAGAGRGGGSGGRAWQIMPATSSSTF